MSRLVLLLTMLSLLVACAAKQEVATPRKKPPVLEKKYTIELAEGWREVAYEEASLSQYALTENGFGTFDGAYSSRAPGENLLPNLIVMRKWRGLGIKPFDEAMTVVEVANFKRTLRNAEPVHSFEFKEGTHVKEKEMTFMSFDTVEDNGKHTYVMGIVHTSRNYYMVGGLTPQGDAVAIEQLREMIYSFEPLDD